MVYLAQLVTSVRSTTPVGMRILMHQLGLAWLSMQSDDTVRTMLANHPCAHLHACHAADVDARERVAACRWSAMPTGEHASFGDIKYHAPIRGSKVRQLGLCTCRRPQPAGDVSSAESSW
jgi:hypothetical protein